MLQERKGKEKKREESINAYVIIWNEMLQERKGKEKRRKYKCICYHMKWNVAGKEKKREESINASVNISINASVNIRMRIWKENPIPLFSHVFVAFWMKLAKNWKRWCWMIDREKLADYKCLQQERNFYPCCNSHKLWKIVLKVEWFFSIFSSTK